MATIISKTLRAAGGDYTSLSAWEAVIPADLVTLDEQWELDAYADWPAGLDDNVAFAARTNDATHRVVIRAAPGHEHDGTLGTGFFLSTTTTFITTLDLSATNYHDLYHVCVDLNDVGGGRAIDLGQYGITDACIAGNSTQGARFAFEITSYCTLLNCLVIGMTGAGSRGFGLAYTISNTTVLYNCTATGNAVGYDFDNYTDRACELKNCIGYNNTTDFLFAATHINDIDYCASSDTSAEGVNSITGITSIEFLDAINDDYHLDATSQLIGAGVNLDSVFTTDVDGDTRPANPTAWDIGFDHYVGGGGGITVIIGQAIENSLAQLVSLNKTIVINSVTETDIAQPVSTPNTLSILSVVENDTAQPVSYAKFATIAPAIELDSSLGVSHDKTLAIGQAQELDQAQPLTPLKYMGIGSAAETDLAQSLSWSKSLSINPAQETDVALWVATAGGIPIGQALESDTAMAVDALKHYDINPALETDQALSVNSGAIYGINPAQEMDSAWSLQYSKSLNINPALEQDMTLPLMTPLIVQIGQTLETDTAFSLINTGAAQAIKLRFEWAIPQRIMALDSRIKRFEFNE